METQEIYSQQWSINAEHFNNNNSYLWMCGKIHEYKTVLEIGCGTGQSTVALLKNKHKVIAIEKNIFCIEKAKTLISDAGFKVGTVENLEDDFDVLIIHKELLELANFINQYSFDIVVCWNVGSYWDEKMIRYYEKHMLKYGLTLDQISEKPESSYGELIQWHSCKIAKENNVPIHLIDRGPEALNSNNDPYYSLLKKELNFSNITYDSFLTQTISKGGRLMTVNGRPCLSEFVDIYLNSILMNP